MKTRILKKAPTYLILLIVLVIQAYPIFWIFMSSIKPAEEHIYRPPYALPEVFTLDNYRHLIDTPLVNYFKNSMVVAALTLLGIMVLASLASYPLSKMEFRCRKLIRNFFMMGFMIPLFVSLIPMFSIYNALGLKNTYWSLIIPQLGFSTPMAIYLYMGFLDKMPDSLLEAAYIDGATSFQIFFRIVIPLLRNVMASVTIFNFVFVWNEFTFANTFISSSAMKTIPIGLNDFVNNYGLRDWGLTFAAVSATIIPTLIVYFILNKQVISGLTAGAIKS
jgi:raffinose/stachyose/melibiose transport system permease protein